MSILSCEQLTKQYGPVTALDNVNLSVEPGRIVGLLGPNGSGKTTLIKLANGLLTPSGGRILINGMAPGVETKKLVSYLPERTYLANWMSVRQTLNYFEDFYEDFDRERAVSMLAQLGIPETQRIKQMSKGNREKV